MKKYIPLLGLFIFSFLFIDVNIVRGKTKYSCEYTVNFHNFIGSSEDRTMTFKISVTDGEKAIPDDTLNSLSGSDVIGNNILTWTRNFWSEYNEDALKRKSCPSIKLSLYQMDNNITGSLSSYSDPNASDSILLTGKSSSEEEVKEIKTICTRTSPLRNQPYSIEISFGKQGNRKLFRIKEIDRNYNSGWLLVGEIATDSAGNTYEVASTYSFPFFSSESECQSSRLYLRVKNVTNNASSHVIQTAKPHASQNGAYDGEMAQIDTGKTTVPDPPNEQPDKNFSSGCDAIGSETLSLIEDIYDLMKFAIPILIIVLSAIDFIKVLLNGEEKVYKSAWNKFVKRIFIGIIILILPILLSIVIKLSGVTETYGIDNIFCILE